MTDEQTSPAEAPKPALPARARNHWRHGRYAKHSILLGKAPKGMARPVSDARKIMDDALAAVCELRGETTLYDFSVACELAEAEVTRRACWRLWQRNIGRLTVAEELQIRRDAMKAAETRSRCLARLGLDKPRKEPELFSAEFYASLAEATSALPQARTQEASDGPGIVQNSDVLNRVVERPSQDRGQKQEQTDAIGTGEQGENQ
jgi:hypothetical protein